MASLNGLLERVAKIRKQFEKDECPPAQPKRVAEASRRRGETKSSDDYTSVLEPPSDGVIRFALVGVPALLSSQ